MAQYGWEIDLERCTGCKTCVVACKSENNTPLKTNYRTVITEETGVYPNPKKIFVTMACNHCADPACIESCPVGAITKRASDGIVLIDQDICVGCRYCVWACPYGAPRYNPNTRKVEKCTLCAHRVGEGLNPACVDACVGRAIKYTRDFVPNGIGNAPDRFANPKLTHPSIRFI
ncbi:MAG: 4Fe-4S dicluster domain-containing protein [Candidatus Abyssobacteria bacterium SURF_5]|uniref:4Fe-4S dicluster domain-containing protein n=1 Tax=Abyssobacteria bacterium (strain SURF_5) TaxID=2093360 RepID=A0A3A4NCB1_ABYX5|nr:MAG: 4Fe-4S dicluster domain-containing protein [Candidatus Abyssubacteria bacterium SURF_5]